VRGWSALLGFPLHCVLWASDLDACNQMGNGPFDAPEVCNAEMARLREQAWLPANQRTGMEGNGHNRMSDSTVLHWHREYVCKGRPT
jgi:hypothetical protein